MSNHLFPSIHSLTALSHLNTASYKIFHFRLVFVCLCELEKAMVHEMVHLSALMHEGLNTFTVVK